MFESIAQGFVGLALFVTQLVSPAAERVELRPDKIEYQGAAAIIRTNLTLPLDPQAEQLIDAGVPLRVRIIIRPEGGQDKYLQRTLRFNTTDYSYTYSDSSGNGIQSSRKYAMVLLALKDFGRIETVVSRSSGRVTLMAEVLPSRIERLNRTVDMRRLFGKASAELNLTLDKGQ